MIYTVTLNPSIDYVTHLDEFVSGDLNRSKYEYANVGGKGIMVSKLLHNIGIDNIALGFLGGFTGNYIREWFKNNGYSERFTEIEGLTRINVKIKSNDESELNGRGPEISSVEQNNFLDEIRNIKEGDSVIISGSLAYGLDDNLLDQIIDICRDNRVDFVVDTTGERLMRAIKKKPLVIKPNIHELVDLFGVEMNDIDTVIEYGRKCQEMGAKYTIVSMGGDGALFFDGDCVYFADRLDGELVNSVGAGDSMLAGFVGSIKSGKTPLESFKYSVACGSQTAFSKDIGDKTDIDRLYKIVSLRKI